MKKAPFCLAAVLLLGCLSTACSGNEAPASSLPAGTSFVSGTQPDVSAGTSGSAGESTQSGFSEADASSQTETAGGSRRPSGLAATSRNTSRGAEKPAGPTVTKSAVPAGSRTESKASAVSTTTKQQEDAMTAAIQSFLQKTPVVTPMPAYNPDSHPSVDKNEWANIQAITYDGAAKDNRKTKVFAYMGFPEGASASSKVPAVVLVHGGGGHAYAEWVKLWTDRGYAAIAMDTTGFFPSAQGKGIAGHEADNASLWHFGLYGDFAQSGYVNAPNNDEMASSSKAFDQQWMYHALAGTILAHNILAADSRVDASKIGITGISWGGVITSLAIGYDTRYAFAAPIYGSGYLDVSHGWEGPIFSKADTKKIWTAANRFDKVRMPVLWMGWSNDIPFSVNSNSLSYDDTKKAGAILSLKIHWGHSHGMGWQPQEIYRFADSVVKNGPTLTTVATEPKGRSFSFTIQKASDATRVTAQACYLTKKLSYSSKKPGEWPTIDSTWKSVDCTIEGNTVTGTLPSTAAAYYVELTTKTPAGSYITTTRFVEGLR